MLFRQIHCQNDLCIGTANIKSNRKKLIINFEVKEVNDFKDWTVRSINKQKSHNALFL